HQGVNYIVVVLNINIACLEGCLPSTEIYFDCVFGNRDRPEQSTFRDPRVEIVNLHVLHGTCEYIKSYEGERAVVVAPIRSNAFAPHEANVGFERKMLGSLAINSMCAHAAYSGPANKPVEVRDGR